METLGQSVPKLPESPQSESERLVDDNQPKLRSLPFVPSDTGWKDNGSEADHANSLQVKSPSACQYKHHQAPVTNKEENRVKLDLQNNKVLQNKTFCNSTLNEDRTKGRSLRPWRDPSHRWLMQGLW